MTVTLLRGRTLSFLRWPETVDDHAAYAYQEDGGILVDKGKIVAVGPYAEVARRAGPAARTIDEAIGQLSDDELAEVNRLLSGDPPR